MASHPSLNAVGDDATGDQGVFHPFGSHADPIAPCREAERLWHRTVSLESLDGAVGKRLNTCIAGIHRGVAVSHANNRFAKVAVLETDGAQHCAPGRSRIASCNDGGTPIEICHLTLPPRKSLSPL